MNVPGPVSSNDSRAARPVFISFSSTNQDRAIELSEALEARAVRCWMSCRDVDPGENYQEAIVQAIRGARAMVLVFSSAANSSDEIKKELSLASRNRIPVIAVRIENAEPTDAFAYELSTRQWIDALHGWDMAIDRLVSSLDHVGQAIAGEPLPTRPRLLSPRVATVCGAVALVGVLAVGLYFWRPFPRSERLTVQIADIKAVDVPQGSALAFQQALADAISDENVVQIKDKDATYALTGTITNLDGKFDYAVRLTNPLSGDVLWSANRTVDMAAGAAGPQQAAASVSWVVRCALGDAMESPRPLSEQALSLYLQHCQLDLWGDGGLRWPLQVKSDKNVVSRRLDIANQLIADAPYFSRSWSLLARDAGAAAVLATPFGTSPQAAAKLSVTARDAVHRALQLDPRDGYAYLSAAYLVPWRDWTQREAMHKRSAELSGRHCGCEHEQYALLLLRVGRPSDAIVEAQRALDIQPNSASALDLLAISYYAAGHVADGDRVVASRTSFWKGTSGSLNMTLYQAIETKRWAQAADVSKQIFDQPSEAPLVEAFAALASGNQARIASARSVVVAMPLDLAVIQPRVSFLVAIGDSREAMAILTPQTLKREPAMDYVLDPQVAPLRTDPAWIEMLKQRGMIYYWRKSKKAPEFCKSAKAPPVCQMI